MPRNRLRFGERAFAVDRLEGFADACSEIRHVTLSASDIDDRPVWVPLVKVVMRLWSSGKGCRKSLSSPSVALELEACVWGDCCRVHLAEEVAELLPWRGLFVDS